MTADMPCAPASMLAPLLGAAAEDMTHTLFDIAELADAVGCETMEVTLDYRQHGTESLLLPGLAEFQGPALCVMLPGAFSAVQCNVLGGIMSVILHALRPSCEYHLQLASHENVMQVCHSNVWLSCYCNVVTPCSYRILWLPDDCCFYSIRDCTFVEQGWYSAGRSCVSYSVQERRTESEGEPADVAPVC